MCVILVCDKKKPTKAALLAAQSANPHGMGIAWIDKGVVRWEKGIEFNQLTETVEKIKLPFVIHFRIATVGAVGASLCHPFPISASALGTSGASKRPVLFHNGHWGEWQDALLRSLTASGHDKLPEGDLSDSRAMAILAHRHGVKILNLVPKSQRIAVVSKTKVEWFGTGWTRVAGMMVSNEIFLSRLNPKSSMLSPAQSSWLERYNNGRRYEGTLFEDMRQTRDSMPFTGDCLLNQPDIRSDDDAAQEIIEATDERGNVERFRRERTTWGGMPVTRVHNRR